MTLRLQDWDLFMMTFFITGLTSECGRFEVDSSRKSMDWITTGSQMNKCNQDD